MADKFCVNDNNIDNHVDEKIKECIKGKRNFFMFAGAGSGKTRSLVNALIFIADECGETLNQQHKKVAVITYTNAACDEIVRRIGYNPLFAVSTIHSFLWELIKPYQRDIKTWVKSRIEEDIAELRAKQAAPRARKDYSPDIAKKQARLDALKNITIFSYDPNGENVGRDSLNHAEVISMGASFIGDFATMQKVLVSKFPILLIDESQDTKKELVDALLKIEAEYAGKFTIGMFGDTLQRIYADGKENMADIVPKSWEFPAKKMNHRSTKRVIQLANAIRSSVDEQRQQARTEKAEGYVRLFIASNSADKNLIENEVYKIMHEITGDEKWLLAKERKVLVLEHSMAASKLGFKTLNEKLSRPFDPSFRDGSLSELSFLMNIIYPLITAQKSKNDFFVMRILREHAVLLKKQNIPHDATQSVTLKNISKKLDDLVALWKDDGVPACIDIYKKLQEINLFELPKRIEEVLSDETEVGERIAALREGLLVPFSELIDYWEYIKDNTQFSTHQGIKGLEFDRVAVIMDDESAGGFLFSYEKLFGAKDLSDTDKKNESEGKDSSLSRTKRLLYVTCTRAKESLALIAYTNNPNTVKQTALANYWFDDNEIQII